MKKRIMSMLLVACFIVMLLPSFAFAATPAATTFADMPNDYSTAALNAAVANGLLNGTDGQILPNNNLTRAQLAAIIVRAFGATLQAPLTGYTDVASSAWYYTDMGKAVKMKVFNGDKGLLNPDANITRQEAFAVLARALKLNDGTATDLNAFSDKADVASWAVGTTSAMIKGGYVHGAGGVINPTAFISRKDFAVLLDNIVKNYIKASGTLSKVSDGSVMINVPDVTLQNVTVKGNLIIGDGVGDGTVTLDNVKVSGATIVRGGGVNSIIVKGGSSLGTVSIAKVDGNVRVHVEDTSSVEIVEVQDGKDDVIIQGSIGTLNVSAAGVPVSVQGATIKAISVTGEKASVTIDKDSNVADLSTAAANTTLNISGIVGTITTTATATGTTLSVAKGATVTTVNAAGAQTTITGDGTVKNANVTGNNVKVDTAGTQVSVSTGITGTTSGGKAISGGTTSTTAGQQPSGGGSSSGGGYVSVPVTGITVTGANGATSVVIGQKLQMTAVVTPANATDQSITWSIASGTGANIDSSGLLTASVAGTVTVKATNAASGKSGTTDIMVITEVERATAALTAAQAVEAQANEKLEAAKAAVSQATENLEAAQSSKDTAKISQATQALELAISQEKQAEEALAAAQAAVAQATEALEAAQAKK